jgi:hypothetical protein
MQEVLRENLETFLAQARQSEDGTGTDNESGRYWLRPSTFTYMYYLARRVYPIYTHAPIGYTLTADRVGSRIGYSLRIDSGFWR